MANYVYNTLTILGEEKDLEIFREFAETNKELLGTLGYSEDEVLEFDFRNFVSPKENIQRHVETWNANPSVRTEFSTVSNLEDYWYKETGHDWCIKNWGCKNNADEVSYQRNTNQIVYFFKTPWSAPDPVIKKASELFPELDFVFDFEEESYEFAGTMKFKKGELIENLEEKPLKVKCPHCDTERVRWEYEDVNDLMCWECGKEFGDDFEEDDDDVEVVK